MKKPLLAGVVMLLASLFAQAETAGTDFNLDCQDAQILQNMISQICWSCVLPMRIMGVGPSPDGAAPAKPVCYCTDNNGIPAFGWQLGYFQPARLEEVVKTPWCSPFLGGVKLQSNGFEYGKPSAAPQGGSGTPGAFADSHFFAFPVFQILNLLLLPDCIGDEHMDIDLLSMTEIDPMWSNDLLTFVLNPESVVFANPLALAWCMTDCVAVTLESESERNYFCAGCDGLMYPFTGNVVGIADPVQVSSLILQRQLAVLHRKGMAMKTMGEEEMCGSTYSYFIPRSQYRVSMLYPVPESTGPADTHITSNETSTSHGSGSSDSPRAFAIEDDCCHRLGESIHRWSTLKGGRSRPGKENYVYMIWRYVDCCALYKNF